MQILPHSGLHMAQREVNMRSSAHILSYTVIYPIIKRCIVQLFLTYLNIHPFILFTDQFLKKEGVRDTVSIPHPNSFGRSVLYMIIPLIFMSYSLTDHQLDRITRRLRRYRRHHR
jgi:hypothetical protein